MNRLSFYNGCVVLLRVPSLFYLEVLSRPKKEFPRFYGLNLFNAIVEAFGKYVFIEDMHMNLTNNTALSSSPASNSASVVLLSLITNMTCFFTFFGIAFFPIVVVNRMYLNLVCFVGLVALAAIGRLALATTDDTVTAALCVTCVTLPGLYAMSDLSRRNAAALAFALLLPLVGTIAGLPAGVTSTAHNAIYRTVFLAAAVYHVYYLGQCLRHGYRVTRDGLVANWLAMPAVMWRAYLLPDQLFVFWLGLLANRLLHYALAPGIGDIVGVAWGPAALIFRCVSESCATWISLMALCVTVCYVSAGVLSLVKAFLYGPNAAQDDVYLHGGLVEAVTLLMVAVQTGLTEMQSAQRAGLLIVVTFIVVSSLLESINTILTPHLLSLGAGNNRNPVSIAKAIGLATVLWILPIYCATLLFHLFNIDLWLLIILSSSILTSVQVLSALLMYFIFMYDHLRAEPMASLDDIVFYIKSTVRSLEFLVAVSVCGFGLYQALQQGGLLFNSLFLGCHFYFNIWSRVMSGWQTYSLRRAASRRMRAFPAASAAELAAHADICPICHLDMPPASASAVKRTPCGHLFHAGCLRKWLYIRDTCPLCGATMEDVAAADASAATADATVATPATVGQRHLQQGWFKNRRSAAAVARDARPDAPIIDDTEPLMGEEEVEELPEPDLVSTSSSGEVYDDRDIDLNVYLDTPHRGPDERRADDVKDYDSDASSGVGSDRARSRVTS